MRILFIQLKFNSLFSYCLRQRFYFSVIFVSTPVKNSLRDLQFFQFLGNFFPGLFRRLHSCGILGDLPGISLGQNFVLFIINQLNINRPIAAKNTNPWPFGCAIDLFTDPFLPVFSQNVAGLFHLQL